MSWLGGEHLVEARHRDHGLRILVTVDARFLHWAA